METTREFELAQIKAIRFAGNVGSLIDTDLVAFGRVKRVMLSNDFVGLLKGVESKLIGMLRVSYLPTTRAIHVGGLIDYQSPERLLLENGELSLFYELSLGEPNAEQVELDDDGKASPTVMTIRAVRLVQCTPGNLKPKEMSWEI